ncbi:MAG: tryptophan--tRNA ligase [bacterium]|nr:tryptophan--tRNA ligase [bacterium]
MKKVFSGIQPSGVIHLGNYLGAIKQWVELQDEADQAVFCIVDLHAITVPQDPKTLKQNILSVAALYLAAGIDPNKSIIFVQSSRPEHAELAWILNTVTKMGELSRMTQFKDKSQKTSIESASVGLFDYPVLMAADILLYGTTHVPVGEDQKQHVELARDLALRFNSRYGTTFTVPEPLIRRESARIMGLDDPAKKMSKSAQSALNYIAILDDAETIANKIKRAVTDSESEIKVGAEKPAITNLLNIFAEVSDQSVAEIEQEFQGKNYGQFKKSLAEAIVAYLKPIQEKYDKIIQDEDSLKKILEDGSRRAKILAEKTLLDVKEKIGLGL